MDSRILVAGLAVLGGVLLGPVAVPGSAKAACPQVGFGRTVTTPVPQPSTPQLGATSSSPCPSLGAFAPPVGISMRAAEISPAVVDGRRIYNAAGTRVAGGPSLAVPIAVLLGIGFAFGAGAYALRTDRRDTHHDRPPPPSHCP